MSALGRPVDARRIPGTDLYAAHGSDLARVIYTADGWYRGTVYLHERNRVRPRRWSIGTWAGPQVATLAAAAQALAEQVAR